MICSLLNDTRLVSEDVDGPVVWEGLVSIGTLVPPADCLETTSEAEG